MACSVQSRARWTKTIVIAASLASDRAYGRHVVIFQSAAERIRHQLLGQSGDKDVERLTAPGAGWRGRTACSITNWLEESIGKPPSVVRNLPVRSKFSRENPIGSMILWHDAHTGFFRWASIRLPHRNNLGGRSIFGQRRHIRRRKRGGAAEDVFEYPLARATGDVLVATER